MTQVGSFIPFRKQEIDCACAIAVIILSSLNQPYWIFSSGRAPWGWGREKDWLFGQKESESDRGEGEKGNNQIKHGIIWEAKRWWNKDRKNKNKCTMVVNSWQWYVWMQETQWGDKEMIRHQVWGCWSRLWLIVSSSLRLPQQRGGNKWSECHLQKKFNNSFVYGAGQTGLLWRAGHRLYREKKVHTHTHTDIYTSKKSLCLRLAQLLGAHHMP